MNREAQTCTRELSLTLGDTGAGVDLWLSVMEKVGHGVLSLEI